MVNLGVSDAIEFACEVCEEYFLFEIQQLATELFFAAAAKNAKYFTC